MAEENIGGGALVTRYNFGITCRGERNALVWLGEYVGIVIEVPMESDKSKCAQDARRAICISDTGRSRVVKALDGLYRTMRDVTCDECESLRPYNLSGVSGRAPIEIPLDNNGAGGLAHHGVSGISVGIALFIGMCERATAGGGGGGALLVDHVYFYEMSRNFWLPRYNRAFDWYCDDNTSCWGWWTVAMNNFWACVLPELCARDAGGGGFEMVYFGHSRESFRKRMKRDIVAYVESEHDFNSAWVKSRMPWRPNESVNDLMTGLLLVLYDGYGCARFIRGFFRELRNAKQVNETNAGSNKYEECRDNFYRIASLAAGVDLQCVFREQLRWQLSDSIVEGVRKAVLGGDISHDALILD